MSDFEPNVYAPPKTDALASRDPFGRAWRRFVRQPALILALAAPLALASGAVRYQVATSPEGVRSSGDLMRTFRLASGQATPLERQQIIARSQRPLGTRWLLTFGIGLLAWVLTQLIYAAIVGVVLRRESPQYAGLIRAGALGKLLGATLLMTLLTGVGLACCLLPGLLAMLASYFLPEAVILERKSLPDTLRRVFSLTFRGGAAVIGFGLLVVVGAGALNMANPLMFPAPLAQATAAGLVQLVTLPVIALVWLSFWEDAVEREKAAQPAAAA